MSRKRWWWPGACMALLACNDQEPYPEGEFILTDGHESRVWTADPAPVRAEVERIPQDGARELHGTLEVPPERFFMGADGIAAFEITGYDADDQRRAWGRSLLMNTPTLYGYLLPLFVSRTGEFARPPGELELKHGSVPPVTQLGGRWIIAAGDSEVGSVLAEGYDLVQWLPGGARKLRCPDEDAPCSFSALAVVGSAILVGLGEDFLRSYRFVENSGVSTVEYSDANLPDGISEWSELTGGAVVEGPDGDAYIVGATRADSPTTAMLRIAPGEEDSPKVSLRVAHLETARAGAAATWVQDHGLVVVGGSPEGAGAELLAEGATEFSALPFPADPTAGGGIAALDADTVVRIGGRDATDQPVPTASYSLTCEADCVPEPLGGTAELHATSAYALDDGSVLAIGLGTDDVTSAVLLGEGEEQAVVLRESRRGASSLRVSTGHIAVVGGLDSEGGFVSTVELFAP